MTATDATRYLLPCAASFKCLDRFSILDDPGELEDADGQVPFWPLFTALLSSSVETPTQLAELLDTIAVTLRGSSGPAGDYQLLKSFIGDLQSSFFNEYWPLIVQLALDLPQHFPGGSLPVLGTEGSPSSLKLSRSQTACLVVHQFLCTLRAPVWREDFFDFSIWYASGQRHEQACRIYLTCFFTYLDTLRHTAEPPPDDHGVTYTLVTAEPGFAAIGSSPIPLCPIEITIVDNYQTCPVQLGLPSGATVIAANQVHVGSSPEVCPAVLVTPPLEKNQVLVVRGAEAVLNITGQRRGIKVAAHEVGGPVDWRRRTMLFMDALELDVESDENGLPDLAPENLIRDLNKAAIAFSSDSYETVYSTLWGCGTFGGDPFVKVILLWCAASAARTSLKIICDHESQEIALNLKSLIAAARRRVETVEDLIELLEYIPRKTARLATFDCMMEQLSPVGRDP
ncbi:poly glycohydrolase-domain-containing protein [Xylaria telfairii]|nr:poly glycohydrolase-domain-containing protein [Xylaria telfairii]